MAAHTRARRVASPEPRSAGGGGGSRLARPAPACDAPIDGKRLGGARGEEFVSHLLARRGPHSGGLPTARIPAPAPGTRHQARRRGNGRAPTLRARYDTILRVGGRARRHLTDRVGPAEGPAGALLLRAGSPGCAWRPPGPAGPGAVGRPWPRLASLGTGDKLRQTARI